MHLPFDDPGNSQFPGWFTAQADTRYEVRVPVRGEPRISDSKDLLAGLAVSLKGGEELRLTIRPATRQ